MHETTSSMDQAVYVVPYNTEVQEAAYNMQRGSAVQHAARGSAQRASRGTPCTSLPLANKYGPLGRCVQCPYISASYNCARGTMLSIEEHLHHAVRNTRHPASRSAHLHHAVRKHLQHASTCITQCASTCITQAPASRKHLHLHHASTCITQCASTCITQCTCITQHLHHAVRNTRHHAVRNTRHLHNAVRNTLQLLAGAVLAQ